MPCIVLAAGELRPAETRLPMQMQLHTPSPASRVCLPARLPSIIPPAFRVSRRAPWRSSRKLEAATASGRAAAQPNGGPPSHSTVELRLDG